MSLPVITDVWRVTLLWGSYGGVTPRNVFHVYCAGGAADTQVAAALTTALNAHQDMWDAVSTDYSLDSFDLLGLDGASSTSKHMISATTGSATGDTIPSSAALVKFTTGRRGPRNRGRMFLGPVGEGAVSGGYLQNPTLGNVQTAFNGFLAALGAGSTALALVVASYKHASFALVTSVVVENKLGTMRRRQQQLRRV